MNKLQMFIGHIQAPPKKKKSLSGYERMFAFNIC